MSARARQPDGTPARAESIDDRPLNRDDAERLATLLKVVSDPTRLQILSMIHGSTDAEACVGDLYPGLGLRQPTVSHHLKLMSEAGLLRRDKRGREVWYSIEPHRLPAIADILR